MRIIYSYTHIYICVCECLFHTWLKQVKLGHLLIHSICTQTPILARLPLALINVDLTPVSLETGRAGASEAAGVAMASAAVEAWLWLTVVNVDLTSGPWRHESGERCQRYDGSCHSDRQTDRLGSRGAMRRKLLLPVITATLSSDCRDAVKTTHCKQYFSWIDPGGVVLSSTLNVVQVASRLKQQNVCPVSTTFLSPFFP